MSLQKIAAELIGTFALTFLVLVSLIHTVPFATPVVAALTLGLFVYLVGPVSGAHVNPAITIAMLSIKKMKFSDALFYILSQFVGAAAAYGLSRALFFSAPMISGSNEAIVGVGEGIGALFFAFGVTCVVLKKVPEEFSGIVVGLSLLIGIIVSSSLSNGVINPAVAFGIGSFSMMYIIGPVIGAIIGAYLACFVHKHKVKFK